MLLAQIIGDCPRCGAQNSYGNISVGDPFLNRGCKTCNHTSQILLPEIEKKVIYLDQFFFSSAMRGLDARFVNAVEMIKKVCHLQLAVAPYSSVHEEEALEWREHKGMTGEQLLDFIKATARGVEFKKSYDVEHTQILKAWDAFLKGHSPDYDLAEKDAISGALTKWDDYYWVDVVGFQRDPESRRQAKNNAVQELLATIEPWRASSETFEEAVALEIRDSGKLYIQAYIDKFNRQLKGEFSLGTMDASVVEQMLHWLPKDLDIEKGLQKCMGFFMSPHFSSLPHEWLSSHIFATLKKMIKGGAFTNPAVAGKKLNGIFDDIKHISVYAPYCDAIIIDNLMADLVCSPQVALDKRYNVKVFSPKKLDEMLDWLSELESNMSDEHKAAVGQAYVN